MRQARRIGAGDATEDAEARNRDLEGTEGIGDGAAVKIGAASSRCD